MVTNERTGTALQMILSRPKIQQYISSHIAESFINLLLQKIIFVQPDLFASTCCDLKGTSPIATAVD